MIQNLLTEVFRPQKFEHLILPKRISSLLKNGPIQNFLLYGTPGTGKTSAAKVLANFPKISHLYINVSDESSVEVIRDKITKFCSEIDVLHGERSIKLVFLDEMDGGSEQFYKALRGTIEKYAKHCRFIGTCNFINKVPDPIQSRFELINFDFVSKEEEEEVKILWKDRISRIFSKVGIKGDESSLNDFVEKYFPDMRKVLNKIQALQLAGITELSSKVINDHSWEFKELYQLIFDKQDPINNYKIIVSNYGGKVDEAMNALGNEFIDWIEENQKSKEGIIPGVLISVANHQSQRHLVIDPVVSLCSLIFTIQNFLKK